MVKISIFRGKLSSLTTTQRVRQKSRPAILSDSSSYANRVETRAYDTEIGLSKEPCQPEAPKMEKCEDNFGSLLNVLYGHLWHNPCSSLRESKSIGGVWVFGEQWRSLVFSHLAFLLGASHFQSRERQTSSGSKEELSILQVASQFQTLQLRSIPPVVTLLLQSVLLWLLFRK